MTGTPQTAAGTNTLALLTTATETAVTIVRGFDPGTLDGPNPTASWDSRTLTNHFIAWSAYALELRGRREPMGADITEHDFLADPRWQDAYVAHLRQAMQLWAQPATLAGDIDTGDVSMPAADIATMLLLETVLHGWDVAKASGQDYQSYVADPEFGEAMLAIVAQWAPMYRQYDGFAAEVTVPGDAPALDRALALSGRDPRWSRVA